MVIRHPPRSIQWGERQCEPLPAMGQGLGVRPVTGKRKNGLQVAPQSQGDGNPARGDLRLKQGGCFPVCPLGVRESVKQTAMLLGCRKDRRRALDKRLYLRMIDRLL